MRPCARERWARTPRRIQTSSWASFLSKARLLLLLGLEHLLLADEVGVVVAGPAREPAPVELDDARGEPAQEGAVVGDEEEA